MDKKINTNVGITIFLIAAAIMVLADFMVISYELYGKISFSANSGVSDFVKYNYKDVAGYYTVSFEFDNPIKDVDSNGNEISQSAVFYLHLYEDGTYSYRYSYASPHGSIGKYVIEDNKIIMNDSYLTGSDTSLTATNTVRTLEISADGSLIDKDAPMSNITNVTEIKLMRNYDDPLKGENEYKVFINYINIG